MIKAYLFDFDGTLADSFDAITASTNHTRKTFGLPAMSVAEVRSYVGHGLHQLMHELVPTAPSVEIAVATYREHHQTVAIPLTTLLPDVAQTIRLLHSNGFHLGVCSNKSVAFTRVLTAHLFPNGEFTVVLGPDDVGKPKPDPAMLWEACKRLNCTPSETIYVGDMVVDVLTAKAAGIACWLIDGGAGGSAGWQAALDAKPDRVLKNFREIQQL